MSNLESPAFQRAFVALRYLFGRRDAELSVSGLAEHSEVRALGLRLVHPERVRRAEALAYELSRIAGAIDARTFK